MTRIKIQDYIKDVELNRQRLVNATGSDTNASLSSVVNIATQKITENNSDQENTENPNLCEVRFFDLDGTLLKTEYVEKGGSVTPPNNPNLDPERLSFNRWASAIGNTFENIQHDVDYAPLYTINNNSIYYFISLTEKTGLEIKLPLFIYGKVSYNIDWGDGSAVETYTSTSTYKSYNCPTHTYSEYSDYEITIYNDTGFNDTSNCVRPCSYLLDEDSSLQQMALLKLYTPMYSAFIGNDKYFKNLQYVVCHKVSQSYYKSVSSGGDHLSAKYCMGKFSLIPPNNSGNDLYVYSRWAENIIIDKEFKNSHYSGYNCYTKFILYDNKIIDKLIIPENCYNVTSPNAKSIISLDINNYKTYIKKIINLSPSYISNIPYSNELTLYYLNNNITGLGDIKYVKNFYINTIENVSKYDSNAVPITISSWDLSATAAHIKNNYTTFNTSVFNIFNLKSLKLYEDFDYNLTLTYCYNFEKSSLITILNNVKNMPDTSRTITFSNLIPFETLKVSLINNIYVEDVSGISIVEAFNQKGWTVSFS